MRLQLQEKSLHNDVRIPVSYLLGKGRVCQETAQLILGQESSSKSWDTLLTILERQDDPEVSFAHLQQALRVADQVKPPASMRSEEQQFGHDDENGVVKSRPTTIAESFPMSSSGSALAAWHLAQGKTFSGELST